MRPTPGFLHFARAKKRQLVGFVDGSLGREATARHLVAENGHVLDAGRVAPAVVEIEQGADADGVVERFIGPAGAASLLDVVARNLVRGAVHLGDELEQRLLGVRDRRGRVVPEDRLDQFLAAEQFRRDRGVRADSKRALVAAGGEPTPRRSCPNQGSRA